MNHHTQDAVCPLCEEKRKDAHPVIADWFLEIKKAFPEAHLSWTYRDQASQDLAFNNHKTKLKFPNSAHNHRENGKPYSRAMDIFRIREDKVPEWSKQWMEAVWRDLQSKHAPLFWGGNFKSLGDYDHFQLLPSVT